MTIATSRNLTVLGIATVVGALAAVATALFDGDPATNPDWNVTLLAIISGVGQIMSKGQKSTGGIVDASGQPVLKPVQ